MTAPFGIYDLVEDVLAVMDREGVGRAVWAGLSIGGMVALRAALVAKERVAGLVLLGTDAGRETASNKVRHRVMEPAVRALPLRLLSPVIVRLFFGPETRASRKPLVREWKRRFESVHVPSMIRTMQALRSRDSILDRLGEIDVPALVIVGECDGLLPPPLSRAIASGLPDASLVVVEKAGHLTALERPELVNPAIASFLEERFGRNAPAPDRRDP